jgi:hypothetical protein
MRVGQKQKKIDINIPKLDDFIHKAYINVARKIYKNVYLFEISAVPLQVQKHNRELEIIVQECILNAVRESIPIEGILRAYMDETVEEDVVEEIKEQVVEKSVPSNARGESEFISEVRAKDKEAQIVKQQQGLAATTEKAALTTMASASLKFNDVDSVMDNNNREEFISAPKSLDRLEEISKLRNEQRKMDEDDDDDVLKISDQDVELGSLDIHVIDKPEVKLDDSFLLNDVEILL